MKIAVLKGDGIGPEIVEAAQVVLKHCLAVRHMMCTAIRIPKKHRTS